MSLADFDCLDEKATVTVVDRESEDPVYRLLTGLFDEEAVTVRETTTTDAGPDLSEAVLVRRDDRVGMAVSPLDELRDELLLVNADTYVTGARGLGEVDTPDVVTELDEIPFTVTGYPDNSLEKLLLIEISRHIEAMAWRAGEGRLSTGFQYLSRLDDERGTRRVYARIGRETDVDTHVYGVPDADPSLPGVTVHGEDTGELRQSWFVCYRSSHHPQDAAGLLALQTGERRWRGCWTYDADRVAAILDYLDDTYG